MAELALTPPSPLTLDYTTSNQQTVWEEWLQNIEMYFIAANITDDKRKQALLLYVGGNELRKIHKTLDNGSIIYKETIELLNKHFEIDKNITYERHKFRSRSQNQNESTVSYITELRRLAKSCQFDEYSSEEAIIDQFIENCQSTKLRRQLLKESKKLTLAKVIKHATLIESSEAQANEIEIKEESVNKLKISNDEQLFQLFKQKQLQQRTNKTMITNVLVVVILDITLIHQNALQKEKNATIANAQITLNQFVSRKPNLKVKHQLNE
jgi:hypothetical protein